MRWLENATSADATDSRIISVHRSGTPLCSVRNTRDDFSFHQVIKGHRIGLVLGRKIVIAIG